MYYATQKGILFKFDGTHLVGNSSPCVRRRRQGPLAVAVTIAAG